MYQPFQASWQMVIRPSIPFPPPPLRFRTAGFPQYGSKRDRQRPPSPMGHHRFIDRFRLLRTATRYYARLIGLASHPSAPAAVSDPLVQWPLAPPAVVLSASLVAYYGHLRASARHAGFIFLYPPFSTRRRSPLLSGRACRRAAVPAPMAPVTHQRTRSLTWPSPV